MKNLILIKKNRTFLPKNISVTWNELAPLFDNLKTREINSVKELEKWMADRSELEAMLEEDAAWRYIRMTCNTNDEKLLEDFQYFATEIEPKIAPISNELNEKLVSSPFVNKLAADKYFIYLRGVKKNR